ncbi:MAG: 2-dehydro-3-deoxy-6-phosphogalactonate aldolase [Hyphomicrobiaceae bacterium]|nr:2-dehydro-3-deoxy-6-phosphogalactonate aldolase [Hyphomicrobiaceae bacterium]
MSNPLPLIAILRGIEPPEVIAVCEQLISAGISMIEIPLNSPRALVSIEHAAPHFASQADIGAGTVLSIADVEAVHEARGAFIVSPDCNPAIIGRTLELGMQSFPGVMTPTEAFVAIRAGATGLKVFPSEIIGPAGIRAMRAVLPKEVPVYAVGGANPDNFADYVAAGADGFGLGSFLYVPGRSAAEVGQRARDAVFALEGALNAKRHG